MAVFSVPEVPSPTLKSHFIFVDHKKVAQPNATALSGAEGRPRVARARTLSHTRAPEREGRK